MSERIVEHVPTDPNELRWHGRLEGDAQARQWEYQTIQRVIERMNQDLGEVPDRDYLIRE
jgi:hypothetical protein